MSDLLSESSSEYYGDEGFIVGGVYDEELSDDGFNHWTACSVWTPSVFLFHHSSGSQYIIMIAFTIIGNRLAYISCTIFTSFLCAMLYDFPHEEAVQLRPFVFYTRIVNPFPIETINICFVELRDVRDYLTDFTTDQEILDRYSIQGIHYA